MKRKDGNIVCFFCTSAINQRVTSLSCSLMTKLLSCDVLDVKVCSTGPGEGSAGLCVRILGQQHGQYPRSSTSQGPAAQ